MAAEVRAPDGAKVLRGSYLGPLAGKCLADSGAGKLLGVFHHGWYLDCGGQIVLLHDAGYGEVPFGIGISGFEAWFPCCREWEGGAVHWEADTLLLPNGQLRLPPAAERPRQMLDADVLRQMLPSAQMLLMQEGRGFLRNLLPCRQQLMRGETPVLAGDAYLLRGNRVLAAFFESLNRDGQGVEEALRSMIGFGVGLTPSMDDWLVGFTYVLLRRPERVFTKKLCGRISILAESRTNRISAAYLRAAASGAYFEALQRAGTARNADDLYALLRIGGSSGCDMLTGMLFAAAYLL